MFDVRAKARIDCPVAVTDSTTDEEYLSELYSRLPGFLDSVCRAGVGLAIYNAGTDVFANDPLGGLNISAEAILKRDLFVVSELRKRNLPTTMVLSGGYTKNSYRIVADSMIELAKIESNEFEM
jgi:histone deacetylase 11